MSSTFYYSLSLLGPSSQRRSMTSPVCVSSIAICWKREWKSQPIINILGSFLSEPWSDQHCQVYSLVRSRRRYPIRDKFDRLLRATTEFTLCVLDRYGLRDHWPARPTLTPQIRFLYIASRICSTLLSDSASRRRPCASLSLLLYQDVKRTFTSKLSNMLGTQQNGAQRGCAPTCQKVLR
jgi:hypothetical protein